MKPEVTKVPARGDAVRETLADTPRLHQRRRFRGEFAVKIALADLAEDKVSIGTRGVAAIYTNGLGGAWAALRRINIRAYTGSTGSIR